MGMKAKMELLETKNLDKLTNRLRCPQCGTRFRVELHKMRLNVPNSCPLCGFQCGISKDQAIRAHRLMEWLEYLERILNPIPQSGVIKFE